VTRRGGLGAWRSPALELIGMTDRLEKLQGERPGERPAALPELVILGGVTLDDVIKQFGIQFPDY
jgi:hypothetical protein